MYIYFPSSFQIWLLRLQTSAQMVPHSSFPWSFSLEPGYLSIHNHTIILDHLPHSVQFSRSVVSNSLWSYGLQQTRLPCPSPTPGACSNSHPSSQWCHPTISSCHPLLLLPSIFPSIRVFSLSSSASSQVAKVLKFQLQHQSLKWIFRNDFF